MRRLSTWLLVTGLLLVGCEVAPAKAPPTEVQVGAHRVRFVVPEGWLHVDHGREQILEREIAHITLSDLGPTMPEGFASILREARELFRRNQWEDAQTLLRRVDPRRLFSSEERWRSVETDWKKIIRIDRADDPTGLGAISKDVEWEVEAAFAKLLAEVGALRDLDLESIARRALGEIGHGEMRSIATLEATAVSGRPAIRIDTWDRLSHSARARLLFVDNAGHLLCLRTGLGAESELAPAFESIARSLQIASDQRDAAGGA